MGRALRKNSCVLLDLRKRSCRKRSAYTFFGRVDAIVLVVGNAATCTAESCTGPLKTLLARQELAGLPLLVAVNHFALEGAGEKKVAREDVAREIQELLVEKDVISKEPRSVDVVGVEFPAQTRLFFLSKQKYNLFA